MRAVSKRDWCVVLLLVGVLALLWSGVLDGLGQRYADGALQGATVTYGIARGMNAAISVAQGTVLDLQVVQVAIGEVLDPVNDMIERFSWLVMLAMASLGIQQLLLVMGASVGFNLLITLSALGYLAARWRQHSWQSPILQALLVLLFLRLALPVASLVSQQVDRHYLAPMKVTATTAINESRRKLDAIKLNGGANGTAPVPEVDGSLFDSARQAWQQVTEQVSPKQKLAEITAAVDGSVEHVLTLMVVFLLQSLLLPLAFLWCLYQGLKQLLGRIRHTQGS